MIRPGFDSKQRGAREQREAILDAGSWNCVETDRTICIANYQFSFSLWYDLRCSLDIEYPKSQMTRFAQPRRKFLQTGTCALFAPAMLSTTGRETSGDEAIRGSAKNCILIYLLGGPPHLDMFDMKPEAPKEIRGPFQPIESDVPGIQVCEHLPKLAQQTTHLAVVRSLTFANNDHPYMIYYTLTGRPSPVPLGANTVLPPSRDDFPHLGAVVSRFKHSNRQVPGYVAIPEVQIRMQQTPVSGGGRAGFLGARHNPLAINDDVCEPLPLLDYPEDVSAQRFSGREKLLSILDGRAARSLETTDYESTRSSAIQLARSTTSGGLLDLDAEPAAVRERYGRHRFGQSLLMARRLMERGTSFVAIHFNHMTKCDGWDTHKGNFDACEKELLPLTDQGVSALLDDLSRRGMLDETLVVVMGEFGRTPKINGNAGRDHWGLCGSVLFAGGGVQGGQHIGSSDKTGAAPHNLPVGPPDVIASIYHALGLNPEQLMYDHLGRPMPLSTGRLIEGLF